jgi:thiol-disulfide isomerase/thioredoxin
MTRLASLVLTLALLASCSAGPATTGDADHQGGSSLQSLVLYDLVGKPIDFKELVGKKVLVISFWATYCKPCKSEMPFLQKMTEDYGEQGLEVVAISQDTPDTEVMVGPFIQRNNYTFKVAIDRQSEATQLLNPKSVLPFLVVMDRAGNIVKTKDGFTVGDQPALEAFLKEQLAK